MPKKDRPDPRDKGGDKTAGIRARPVYGVNFAGREAQADPLSTLGKSPIRFESRPDLLANLGSTSSRLDSVVAASTATGADLRQFIIEPYKRADVSVFPVKSGEEYVLERVEHQLVQVARLAEATAQNTGSLAEISKAYLDQIAVLVASVDSLRQTTDDGIRASNRTQGTVVTLTKVLVGLGVLYALPILTDLWTSAEPLRQAVLDWLSTLR